MSRSSPSPQAFVVATPIPTNVAHKQITSGDLSVLRALGVDSLADDLDKIRGLMGVAIACTLLAVSTALCGLCCTAGSGPALCALVTTAIAAFIAGAH